MFLGKVRTQRGGRIRKMHGRGLGLVSTPVGGSLVYGSSPVRTPVRYQPWGSNPPHAIPPIIVNGSTWPIPVRGGPVYPITVPNGGGYAYPMSAGSGYGSGNSSPLQVAMALLNSNPSLLSQAQWTMLQNAGLVAGTLPYSSAGLVSSGSGAIDPATGQTYSSELAAAQAAAGSSTMTSPTDVGSMLSTAYAGLPLWMWLLIGGGGFYLFSGGRRR